MTKRFTAKYSLYSWFYILNKLSTARYSLSTGGGKTASNLEGVVDNPLKAGEGTDHEDSGTETLPESGETDLSIDLLDLLSG